MLQDRCNPIPAGRCIPWLLNIIGSFLEAMEGLRIVLDPELRTGLLEIGFHRRATGEGLLLIRLTPRRPGSCSLRRIVPQVSRDQDRSRLGEPQRQNLVAGRMTWSGFDDDASITEGIVVGVGEEDRLAVAQPV